MGNSYLDEALGQATSARITLLDPKGNVLFDSLEDSAELENHSNRPEFIQAVKKVDMRNHCDIQKPCPNRIFTVR